MGVFSRHRFGLARLNCAWESSPIDNPDEIGALSTVSQLVQRDEEVPTGWMDGESVPSFFLVLFFSTAGVARSAISDL